MILTLPVAIVLLAIIGIQSYLVFLVLNWLKRMTEAQEAISRTLAIIARNTHRKGTIAKSLSISPIPKNSD